MPVLLTKVMLAVGLALGTAALASQVTAIQEPVIHERSWQWSILAPMPLVPPQHPIPRDRRS